MHTHTYTHWQTLRPLRRDSVFHRSVESVWFCGRDAGVATHDFGGGVCRNWYHHKNKYTCASKQLNTENSPGIQYWLEPRTPHALLGSHFKNLFAIRKLHWSSDFSRVQSAQISPTRGGTVWRLVYPQWQRFDASVYLEPQLHPNYSHKFPPCISGNAQLDWSPHQLWAFAGMYICGYTYASVCVGSRVGG